MTESESKPKRQQALEIIARISERHPESIELGLDLMVDLGLDSPQTLELLVSLEDSLGVLITDEEAARMVTVGDVLDYFGD